MAPRSHFSCGMIAESRSFFWSMPTMVHGVPLTHLPTPVSSAFTWSPDGRSVAFLSDRSVFLVDAASGHSERITSPATMEPRPEACVFSPMGAKSPTLLLSKAQTTEAGTRSSWSNSTESRFGIKPSSHLRTDFVDEILRRVGAAHQLLERSGRYVPILVWDCRLRVSLDGIGCDHDLVFSCGQSSLWIR